MIILLIFLVSIMTLYDYFNLKSSIDTEFANLQNQTEESITAALRLDDSATTVLDDQLNQQMINGFGVLFAEKNGSGGNRANMAPKKFQMTWGGATTSILSTNPA